MDRIDKFTSAGIYSPTFFKILLNTEDNIEELFEMGISERGEAAFLHEYIHLLQDLTTNSGLSNICRTVDYLKCINELAKTEATIKVPFLPEDNRYNVSTNFELDKIYVGSSTSKYSRFTSISLKPHMIIVAGVEKVINSCVINLIGDNGQSLEYIVGEYAISESMAYCIENELYKDVLEKPKDYPYNVVKIVSEHICPDICLNPLNIIAICDACLMYFNSGEILFLSLCHIKTIDYKSITPEKLYDIIINFLEFDFYGNKNTKESFDYLSPLAAQQINDYFTTEIYNGNKLWILQIFHTAYQLRAVNPYFMIDIAKKGRLKENTILMHCLNTIGCPVILNKNKDLVVPIVKNGTDVNKIDPSCFWTINQIYTIFTKNEALKNDTYKCEMIEWCKMSFEKNNVEDLTQNGDSCIYAPWERALDEAHRNKCSFAHIWYSWGMKDMKPIN